MKKQMPGIEHTYGLTSDAAIARRELRAWRRWVHGIAGKLDLPVTH
jgi:hypothetical protein